MINDLVVNYISYAIIQKRKQTIHLEILHWHDTIMCQMMSGTEVVVCTVRSRERVPLPAQTLFDCLTAEFLPESSPGTGREDNRGHQERKVD